MSLLHHSDSKIVARNVKGSSKGSVLNNTISISGESYEVTMNWYKHTWMKSPDNDDKTIYQIGVGAKIVANIFNVKTTVDLTNLGAVAVAAEAGQLDGSISFKRIGISGKVTEIILPGFTETLDKKSVISSVQNMQKIQLLLYSDDDVTITPSTLGYMTFSEAEEMVLPDLLGWVLLGHYGGQSTVLDTTKFSVSGSYNGVRDLPGKLITAKKNLNLRQDKPRFPLYKPGKLIGEIKKEDSLIVEKVNEVGNNKYWALVSKSR